MNGYVYGAFLDFEITALKIDLVVPCCYPGPGIRRIVEGKTYLVITSNNR